MDAVLRRRLASWRYASPMLPSGALNGVEASRTRSSSAALTDARPFGGGGLQLFALLQHTFRQATHNCSLVLSLLSVCHIHPGIAVML